eukprot:CAMPEP_0175588574 /NCGR_PEP_ID=MMETSP0096-20121207/51360_1 /TAXON_ID=311494 /ORGANISM="Alexandrium monilatum, Strain CCMP3105" /LENGTH=108 /DNA_ID=CAMNT_0016892557 /DNA_START=13 /DNA_END=335 /DNA_ORIENTATION=-
MPTTLAELRRDLCWTLVFAAIALLLPAIWAVRIARQFPGTKSEAELLEELGVDTAQPKAAKQQQQQQQKKKKGKRQGEKARKGPSHSASSGVAAPAAAVAGRPSRPRA